MSNPVIIKLKHPIYGGGILTDRPVFHEKVFTESDHGKNYQAVAKEWATTHAQNVLRVEGLDEASEKVISTERKKKAAEAE